ncbi:MRC1-like domain-containing protein [Phaeosphaeriaceae sp. PMI808]|nr:MRC1-like domain-containing protein [Phaeosphaeriaceae sp. PMI808]
MTVDQPTRIVDASPKPRVGLLAALRKPASQSSQSSAESEDDLSESDHDVPTQTSDLELMSSRPQPETSLSQDEGEEDSDTGAAYERMKKRLAASKALRETQKPERIEVDTTTAATLITSEDEDAMPVRTNARRPNMRKAKSLSPPVSPALTRVQRIRAERLAKKEQEHTQRSREKSRRLAQQDSGSDTDDESGRLLTQQAKPTRKAGKKAMELMARDQQRISRNMQLTHQSKTKKKHTLNDLYSRFGFSAPSAESPVVEALPTPDASSALASSDAEANRTHDTPPTSPPREEASPTKEAAAPAPLSEKTSPPHTKIDKGKGRAPEFQHLPPHPWMQKGESVIVQNVRVDVKGPADHTMIELSDSDDDLDIVQVKSRFPVFDRVPMKKQQESSSLLHLRHLAHLTSSKDAQKGSKSISLGEMQMSLAQKAREQAHKEREERIAELKRRGIHIETEEEREKNQMEIEDMVAQFEKQRQEDLKLAKSEREEAKRNGETIDSLLSSDESDGDYVGSGTENQNEADTEAEDEEELELSGSEDEYVNDKHDLVADMADKDEESAVAIQGQEVDNDADMEDEDLSAPIRKRTIIRARNIVVDEEDESGNDTPVPASPTQQLTQNDDMAAFGFGNADTGLGLTQMFAGTMANLESGTQSGSVEPEQDSLDFLRGLPDTQPGANFSQASGFFVPNSQSLASPQKALQHAPGTQFSLGISQLIETSPVFSRTQLDDLPEPTQDAGFSFSRSPAGLVIPPASTVDTVMMRVQESPIKQTKGKLQRGRRDATVELSDVEEDFADLSEEDDIQRPPKPRDAFANLQKGAKKQKAIIDFNKKTSMAKDAVMEQAEESEDEYAGLGGASDDDSGAEDEETKNMIEHGEVDVDERQIAAFFAEKSKREDEKNINELYKNVMNGGLRRRAGGRDGFDMSDSEDEEDMRLRKKRAEFQKMNRALLADERIGNIAKDQKKQAFFHTLADFADEGEYEFLDMPADLGAVGEQSQSQEDGQKDDGRMEDITVPDSQTDTSDMATSFNPMKRKSPTDSQKENRPPPNLRRTAASDNLTRKPITLADVQNSVSELLDDPRIMVPDSQYSESEDDDDESSAPSAASRKPVVDRLSLSRTPSIAEAPADGGNLAFHAPSRGINVPNFRVPSLIRQATSNLSTTSESRKPSGASTSTESVRRGGTGKSNIHAQAREAERRQLLDKKEEKRKTALKKKVNAGRKQGMRSVLGDLGGGFE